jgi:HPt (histidine-containing phosphotransfer) domain-containing protein
MNFDNTNTKGDALKAVEKIRSIFGDDQRQINDLINIFISVVPNQLKELINCIEINDFENLNDKAHTLKPSFEVMGLMELKEKVLTIQELAKNNYDRSELLEVAITIQKKLIEVTDSLKVYLKKHPAG